MKCRPADPDAGQEHLDLGSERLERGLQQQVVLEAVPTAAPVHELALDVLELQGHGDTATRVEVLERDRGDVRTV